MTDEKALEIREFAIDWISIVVANRKDYRQRLIYVIDNLISENISDFDGYQILSIEDWNRGEYGGMGDRLKELLVWNNGSFNLTSKAQNDVICAIRIAIDILINPSGGVVGFTVGDVKKFLAEKPQYKKPFNEVFELDKMLKSDDNVGVWL